MGRVADLSFYIVEDIKREGFLSDPVQLWIPGAVSEESESMLY